MNNKIKSKKIFVTGGAGFIGSRLVRKFIELEATEILVYDSLHPQVHGNDAAFPNFPSMVTCVRGSVEDAADLTKALLAFDPDILVHLAAETGTGQSQHEIARYCTANVTGTANLLQGIELLPARLRPFLLSSSRSIYGEGPHVAPDGSPSRALCRKAEAMQNGDFNVYDAKGNVLQGVRVANGLPEPLSVYASTKLMQEQLLLNCAEPKRLDPKILRFQNVYGPGQSLRNPYTGVLSIFTAQILTGKTLDLYEDGGMVRDFVFVDDVVDACVAVLQASEPLKEPIDIGAGEDTTIREVAAELLKICGADPQQRMHVSGRFRPGDIKYACADIASAKQYLNWAPRVSLNAGLQRLVDWARSGD